MAPIPPPGFELDTEDSFSSSPPPPPGFVLDTESDNPGWIDSLSTSLEKGIGNIAQGIGGGIKFAEDKLGTGTGLGDSILQMEQEYQRPRDELLSRVEQGSPQHYANRVVEGLAGVAPLMLATGPVSTLAATGGLSLGNQYQRMLEQGASEDAATKSALMMAPVDALMSYPLFQTAKAGAPLLSRIGEGALWGGITSVPQTVAQSYADSIGTGEPVKPYDLIDPIKENFITGGLTGAALPAVYEGARQISKIGKGVDAKALGEQLRERLLSREVGDPNAIPVMGDKDLPTVPQAEQPQPIKPLELPEPDPVVQTSEVVKADSDTSSFPAPIPERDIKAVTKVEDNATKPQDSAIKTETDPLGVNSSERLKALSEDPIVKELGDTQAWFEGAIANPLTGDLVKAPGPIKVPAVSNVLSVLRKNSMPKTIADKFPEAKDLYYKGGRAEVENETLVASELASKIKPYFEADNPELVDAYIGQLGEITKQFQRERSVEVAKLKNIMQEASDVASGKKKVPGDVEQQKQYAQAIVQKAQVQLAEVEKRAIPRPMPDDAKALGLTDRDVAAVNAHQETMNHAADKFLRDVFKLQGRKISDPAKKAEYDASVDEYVNGLLSTNYFPARRYGKSWTAYAKDAGGNTLWRVDVDSKRAALKAARTYKNENKGATLTVEAKPEIDPSAFPDMPANLMDAIQTFRPEKWTENAKDKPPTGFTRHLIEAQKIPGYDSIRQSSIDYILSLSRYYGRQQAKAITDDIVDSLPEGSALRGYAKRYADKQLVTPEGAVVKGMMKFQNLMKLAGVPLSAIINTTQTLTTTVPKFEAELTKAFGYKKAAAMQPKMFGSVVNNAFAYLSDRIVPKLSSARKSNPELFAFIDQAQKTGVLESEGLRELYNLRAKLQGKPTAADSLMFMFSAAEQANRLVALLAARESGKAQGLKGDALYDYAKKFVIDTQFDQTVANRVPALAHGVPRVLTQYRPFQMNYIRFLRNNFGVAGAPALGLSLAAMLALGGIKAIPGVRDMEKIAEQFGVNPSRWLKKLIGNDKTADIALSGLPTMAGVSISGAVSPGEFVPELDLKGGGLAKVFGPSADYFVNALPKAATVLKQNEDPITALEIAGPRFARGPLKALRAATSKDGLTNTQGDTLLKNPTPGELLTLSMGATPKRLQDANEYVSERFKLTNRAKEKVKDWNGLIAQAVKFNDKNRLKELLGEINSLNTNLPPEQQIKVDGKQITHELMPSWVRDFTKMPNKARAPLVGLMKEYKRLPPMRKIQRSGVEE